MAVTGRLPQSRYGRHGFGLFINNLVKLKFKSSFSISAVLFHMRKFKSSFSLFQILLQSRNAVMRIGNLVFWVFGVAIFADHCFPSPASLSNAFLLVFDSHHIAFISSGVLEGEGALGLELPHNSFHNLS
jgi:hypothetical protein